mmetsp:Transcript_51676/g.147336  ORF Transcript_51676/g.147336 Transcript_51676/m.147336 type:complete len:99 (-) Transcript_51676:56-352(-)
MPVAVRPGDKYRGVTAELGTYVRIKVPLKECICWDDYEDAKTAPKPAPATTARLGGIDLKSRQEFPTTMERLPPQGRQRRDMEVAPFPAETVMRETQQ